MQDRSLSQAFGTLLKANGEDVKTVQELLRYANSRITLDVYTQAVNSTKRSRTEQGCKDDGAQRGHRNCQSRHKRLLRRGSDCLISGLLCPYRAQIGVSLWVPYHFKCFRMNGRDDGARTRALCRDSELEGRN